MNFPDNGPPVGFLIFMAVCVVFIIGVSIMVVVGIVRSRKVLHDAGLSPLTLQAQIAAGLAKGPLMGRTKTIEQRLAELDDLHQRGVISDAELATARAQALSKG